MQEGPLRIKSLAFALRVVKLCALLDEKRAYVLSKQLLRSGTAIGALVRESEYAESRTDFVHKLRIGLKEANETEYWLELLYGGQLIERAGFDSIRADVIELKRLITSSVNTTRRRDKKPTPSTSG